MSDPYVGEIRMFGGNFAPQGWAFCDGSSIAISDNPALYNLIGTTYGGNGQTTFNLPDLRGRIPLHAGPGTTQTYVIGAAAGTEQVTLNTAQIPVHNHTFVASTASGNQTQPGNAFVGSPGGVPTYVVGPPGAAMAGTSIVATGGGQPHENMMPFLVVSFIICLYGIYPSPT